jgi:hypothetical protein
MAAIVADALLHSAHAARPPKASVAPDHAPKAAGAASLTWELQARIEAARDETLEYHRTSF